MEAGTTLSRAETETTVETMIEFWERNGFGRWSVIEKESGSLIGLCGLRALKGIPELLYLFARSCWDKGCGSGLNESGSRPHHCGYSSGKH